MAKRYPIWLAVLGLMAGCSYYYGKGGIVDQAVLEDIAQSSGRAGMTSCDPDELKAVCDTGDLAKCQAMCDRLLRKGIQK